jgi:hypothetical protein
VNVGLIGLASAAASASRIPFISSSSRNIDEEVAMVVVMLPYNTAGVYQDLNMKTKSQT